MADVIAHPLQPLSPEYDEFVELLAEFVVSTDTLHAMRSAMGSMLPTVELSPEVERTDHVVDADNGVVVRVHRRPSESTARPCVYSIHGGGLVLGSYEMDDLRLQPWVTSLDCVAVSVEYRLAPEHPYPAALDDCYAGLRWVRENAAELGVDPDRIGVAGVSAGGGLAAAVALLARDRGELPVRFQLLDSPMLDDRQLTPSSRTEGLAIWSRQSNEFGWRSYLGDLYGSDDVPYTAAAARAVDLSGLPPAFVCVGSVDGFRDEDVDYALRLNQAGVPAELHVYPGAPHGFSMSPGSSTAEQCARDTAAWLARQL